MFVQDGAKIKTNTKQINIIMNTAPVLLDIAALQKEVFFKMSRSGGNGGQNVNKVATKASLFFQLEFSNLFEKETKELLLKKLGSRISKDGYLIIHCSRSRSALSNKKEALKKLKHLLEQSALTNKKRKTKRIPASAHRKRLDHKKRQSFKKSFRRKVSSSDAIDLF